MLSHFATTRFITNCDNVLSTEVFVLKKYSSKTPVSQGSNRANGL